MPGQCKLCLQYTDALQDSHFLPAGIYRILRDDNEKNPNPWLVSKKVAIQTSWQMKARLLCRDCEQRISKHGEDWVLKNCLKKDGRFPLATVLASRMPDLYSDTLSTKVHYAAEIPEINISALAFFAASIFWRGSIHPWNEDGSIPIKLGPFAEDFRRYLMGIQPFPKDCALWVAVRGRGEVDLMTYPPLGERREKVHIYRFPMPGFGFSLMVSKNIPANYRKHCLVHGPRNPIIVTNVIEELLLHEAVQMRKRNLEPVSP